MFTMALCQHLEELFDVPPHEALSPENEIEQIPGWGSLTFLGLISLVDTVYGVTLKPRMVLQCSTIADLASLIKQSQEKRTLS